MNTTKTTIKPIAGQERKVILDFLRGIAIFGIIAANMAVYNAPFHTMSGEFILWDDTANKIANFFLKFFIEGKFYPLFSLLFGIGFYFFLQKANDTVNKVVFTFRKRLMFLFIFGILHVLLLWYGDVLIVYAIFGLILTWFRNRSNKTLIRSAIIFLMIPVVLIGVLVGFMKLAMMVPEAAQAIEAEFSHQISQTKEYIDKTIVTYSTGSFSEIIRIRIAEYIESIPGYLFFYPNFMAMLLAGFYVGRKKIFEDLDSGVKNIEKSFYLVFAISNNFQPFTCLL